MPRFRHYKALAVATTDASNVDREAGIIRNVSIISTGAAKGHGVLCDDETLNSVLACIQTYKSGLKVKWNARTFDHGPGAVLGVVPVDTCRIEGGQVLGDLVVSKDYPWPDEVKYLYGLAESQADTFGLSIDFSGIAEDKDGVLYMRCEEIYAVTVVDQPAANAAGMFRELTEETTTKPKPTNQPTRMALSPEDKTEIASIVTEAVKPLAERIDKIENKPADDSAPPNTDGMSEEEQEEERLAAGVTEKDGELSANRKINQYRARVAKMSPAQIIALSTRAAVQALGKAGGAPVHGGGGGTGGGADANKGKSAFAMKVDSLVEGGMKKPDAIRYATKNFADLYEQDRAAKQGAAATAERAKAATAQGR